MPDSYSLTVSFLTLLDGSDVQTKGIGRSIVSNKGCKIRRDHFSKHIHFPPYTTEMEIEEGVEEPPSGCWLVL